MKKLKIILLAIILTITATFSFSEEKAIIKVNASFKDECKYMTNVIEKFIRNYVWNQPRNLDQFLYISKLDDVSSTFNKICK